MLFSYKINGFTWVHPEYYPVSIFKQLRNQREIKEKLKTMIALEARVNKIVQDTAKPEI